MLKVSNMYRALLLVPLISLVGCSKPDTIIKISSTPPGARVSEAVKGDLGRTPLQIVYTTDDCEVPDTCMASFYFSKAGYHEARVNRYVRGKEIRVHVRLEKDKTKLIVRGYPAFAKLNVQYRNAEGKWKKLALIEDGGTTLSLEDEEVWGGKDYCFVRIIAESPGYIQTEKTIKIARGEQKVVEYSLEEFFVNGEILSYPPGADVYERTLGYLGRTPLNLNIPYDQLMRISAQRKQSLNDPVYLHLKFTKDGYKPTEKISSVGEISDTQTPVPFTIPVTLIPVNRK